MVYRFTWIATLALLALVVARLSRLFLPSQGGLPWPLAITVAAALGVISTLVAIRARFGTLGTLVTNLVAYAGFILFYVGTDVAGSVIPTPDTLDLIGTEFHDAITVFRFSAPPVSPLPGLVALAGGVVWSMGMFAVWGTHNGAPYLAILPPVVFYLQLAVIDRRVVATPWMAAFLALVGLGLAAIVGDQSRGSGHAGHGRQAALIRAVAVPIFAIAGVTAIAVAGSQALADTVPATGVLEWRNRAGIGGGFGGSISYNPFIDVRRSLVSQTNARVFTADIRGDLGARDLYFRLLSMDAFTGDWWYATERELERIDETEFEDPEYRYRGPTTSVVADVRIERLASQWLPAPYSPNAMVSSTRLIAESARASVADGSIAIDGLTSQGMTYSVRSDVPAVDIRTLASTPDGLSPVFTQAALEGAFPQVVPPPPLPLTPPDIDRYTELPDGIDSRIRALALDLSAGLETDFEKGLALENFLRFDPSFRYSTNIAPNERNSGLAEWLTDPNSPGYRTGYCEQYAASMGVLARLLGIPARVVLGFTPGDVQEDGSVIIRDRNAHAWVELWLPTQGWARFDPTPRPDNVNPTTLDELPFSRSRLERYFDQIEAQLPSGDSGSGSSAFPLDDPGIDDNPRLPGAAGDTTGGQPGFELTGNWIRTLIVTGVVFLGLTLVPTLKRRRRRRRLRRLAAGDISAAWAEIVDRLTDYGDRPHPAKTPLEVAATTDAAMQPLALVYTETAYGPEEQVANEKVSLATASLSATEERLRARASRWRRIRRLYRLDSFRRQRLR
jgi:transglutaminase-like putative cysteine protease